MSSEANIFSAIETGDLERARGLVQRDPSEASARTAEGLSALMMALYYQRAEIAELLQAKIPELDLFEAAATGDTGRVRELLAEDAASSRSASSDGFTALHLACFFGHPEAAQLLIEHGADPNAVANNPTRVSPIHSAVAGPPETRTRLARQLLAAGADVDATQNGGWTALMAVAKHGVREAIELLLEAGADPLKEADDGQTARSMAADEVRELLGD